MQQFARAQAQAARAADAAQRRETRELLRLQREAVRLQAQLDRESRLQYQENRLAEADEMTREVTERMETLRNILSATLRIDDTISFESLRQKKRKSPFKPPAELREPRERPNLESYTSSVRPLGFFETVFRSKSRFEREKNEAIQRYERDMSKYDEEERLRCDALKQLEAEHEQQQQQKFTEIERHNSEIDELERAYRAGEPQAVIAYCDLVLEGSDYPDDFPRGFKLAYVPEGRQLVSEYELPPLSVVPTAIEFKYIKSKDTVEQKARKTNEIKDTYQDVVAAIALRTLHEIFESDQGDHVDVAVFNGFVNTVDRATGREISPHLISVRAVKKSFLEIDLSRVDKKACLRNLGAQVSPQPAELQPVKPIVEFNMVDKRFVEGADLLQGIESRPNLMQLSPFDFEQLVGNLFAKMGLETKQTRAARDGGVDVVAFDTRPLIGGKVVIQAKRWKNTVGVSAVRDLFGTMNHEGANKGILVSTSSYGPDAYEFAKGKPVELIDGGGLLYYLEQHAGVQARIVFPDEQS